MTRGVDFRSLTEAIDTTTAGGKLAFHIFGALAKFARSLIRERTLAGLAAPRARGRKGGRRPVLSAADVRKAAAMLADPEITKTKWPSTLGSAGSPRACKGRPDFRCGEAVILPSIGGHRSKRSFGPRRPLG